MINALFDHINHLHGAFILLFWTFLELDIVLKRNVEILQNYHFCSLKKKDLDWLINKKIITLSYLKWIIPFNFTVQQSCTTLQVRYLYLWNEARSPVKPDHNTRWVRSGVLISCAVWQKIFMIFTVTLNRAGQFLCSLSLISWLLFQGTWSIV